VVPAQRVTTVGVLGFLAVHRRGLVTELLLGFVTVLEGQLQAVVVGRLEVDLGERSGPAGTAGWPGPGRRASAGTRRPCWSPRHAGDGHRQIEALGFIGHEEVGLVLMIGPPSAKPYSFSAESSLPLPGWRSAGVIARMLSLV
jgi:hypothetical protein